MKLQQIQTAAGNCPKHDFVVRINKDPNFDNVRRQLLGDSGGLFKGNATRARRVKDETNRVGSELRRGERVERISDATNLDCNGHIPGLSIPPKRANDNPH